MASSGSNGDTKHLRVLVPFSRDTLRIPDKLAEDVGAEEALIVSPAGGKVWRVELRRDGDGAFLVRGWPEFAAACGVGAGWLLVLRHRGRGVLTLKAFDDTCCLRQSAAPTLPAVEATTNRKASSRRPQFISLLPANFTEKMLIPAKFVQQYIRKEHLRNSMAVVLGPLGKVSNIKLELDRSDVFFAGGWSQFLSFHGISASDTLLLRYERNMVFTVKVFEADGCQRVSKNNEIRVQQSEQKKTSTSSDIGKKRQAPCALMQKRKRKKATLRRTSFFEIGPPSWIKKQINRNALGKHLALAKAFCDAIGLREPCMITLKTSTVSVPDLGWCVVSQAKQAATYLCRAGRSSARITVSRKVTFAPLMQSKPHCGTSLSRVAMRG